MTQDELRRKCEEEAQEIMKSSANKMVSVNDLYDRMEKAITEALLQREMEIEMWQLKYHVEVDADRIAEIKSLQEKLRVTREALKDCDRNDKTDYDYHGKHALNRFGRKPDGVGKRWQTPSEIAKQALQQIGE